MKSKFYLFIFVNFIFISASTIAILKKNHYYFKQQTEQFKILQQQTEQFKIKVSMDDNIFILEDGTKFYVPNYPIDWIQNKIVSTKNFYEIELLKKFDKYLPENAVIADIGANIGNHTLYWLLKSNKKPKFIYAFEVINKTFDKLKKNVEINNLQNKTKLFNFGLGDKTTNGKIFFNSTEHTGEASVRNDTNGNLKLKRLDDVFFNKKIDVVKIDVEGFEWNVIKGGEKFFEKNKPIMWIELFYNEEKILGLGNERLCKKTTEKVEKLLEQIGYKKIATLDETNYIFQHKSKIK